MYAPSTLSSLKDWLMLVFIMRNGDEAEENKCIIVRTGRQGKQHSLATRKTRRKSFLPWASKTQQLSLLRSWAFHIFHVVQIKFEWCG